MCFNNWQNKIVIMNVQYITTLAILSPNVFFRNKNYVDIAAHFPHCLLSFFIKTLLMALAVESVQDGCVNTLIPTITRNLRRGNPIHGKVIERLLH